MRERLAWFQGILKRLVGGGFFHILVGTVLAKAATLISSIVIVRLVDKSDYAYLAYADNLFSYGGLLSGLGMCVAVLKYCSETDDKSLKKAYFIFAAKFGALFDLLVAICLCVAISFIDVPFPEARIFMWLMLLLPPLNFYLQLIQCYNRANMYSKQYSYMALMQSAVLCAVSVLLVILIGIKGSIIARYIAVAVAIIYGGKYIFKEINGYHAPTLTKEQTRKFMSLSITLMTASMFSMIMPINEAFLVNNIIQNDVVTADFKIAGIFPQQILLVANAVAIYYFPIISKIGDRREAFIQSRKIAVFCFFLVLLIMLVGIIATPLLIKVIYGDRYLTAVRTSNLLWCMYGINAAVRILPANIMPAVGEAKFNAIMSISSCIVHVSLEYFFISKMGINGVAYASIIVYSIAGIIYWMYFYLKCGRRKSLA